MINGLQATVPGTDVIRFANERVNYHIDRASHYKKQVEALAAAGIENTSLSNDPKAGAISKEKEHTMSAQELAFLVGYIKADETYLLSLADLQKLGKVSRGY